MFVNGLRGLRVARFVGLGIMVWRRLSPWHAPGAGFRNFGYNGLRSLRVTVFEGPGIVAFSGVDLGQRKGLGLAAADSSARTRVEC